MQSFNVAVIFRDVQAIKMLQFLVKLICQIRIRVLVQSCIRPGLEAHVTVEIARCVII